ncbi:hypothetical protein DH2020_034833 [Rehmannia glutinosa]|uniref:Uncharacterized protein n=1 Tax=Rehmannia glutinosa TaxID=99300 RepID=A0ABR0VAH4_REHGL
MHRHQPLLSAQTCLASEIYTKASIIFQTPSVQQALSHQEGGDWINELLEGSLRLVDLCGFSREVVCLTKESIQELESSIRRKADDINAYETSRKKINKMIIKNLKSFNQNCAALPEKDSDLKAIGSMLKETEALDFSVLKSVLIVLSEAKGSSKQRSWSSLFSKFVQTSRVSKKGTDNINLKQLKATEMTIQEIEEGLEGLFRSLVKTRVSLLNALSH